MEAWNPNEAASTEASEAQPYFSSEDGIRDDTGKVIATPAPVVPPGAPTPTAAPQPIDYTKLAAEIVSQQQATPPNEQPLLSPDGTMVWNGNQWVERQ